MSKRKSKVNPTENWGQRPADDTEINPGTPPLPAAAVAALSAVATVELIVGGALSDILRCNTARKCHDRARVALKELEK